MLKKRIFAGILPLVLIAALFAAALPISAEGYTLSEGTTVYAGSALVMSLGSSPETDVVLFARAADEVHAPGAMMRYMVVAYALHRIGELGMDMDTATGAYTLEMFNECVAGTGVPTANMQFGETWTLRDLMTVSFFQNASDAVTTLAYALDGGVKPFVRGMNALAAEIGCDHSHFANVTGLDSLSQYTTARDMYRIIRYAGRFSEFEDMVSQRQYTVHPVAGGKARTLTGVNSMMQSSSVFYYAPLVHSRTGLSDHEGRTCASVARDSGYEYLTVVMACPETNAAGESGLHFRDTRTLFRWAYNQFTYATVLGKSEILASVKVDLSWSTDHVNLVPAKEFATVVENKLDPDQVIKKVTLYQDRVEAPVEKGTVYGKVELIVNVDQKIGEVDLVASDSISRNWLLFAWSGVAAFLSSGWFWLGLGALILLLAGYALLNVVYNRRRRMARMDKLHPDR